MVARQAEFVMPAIAHLEQERITFQPFIRQYPLVFHRPIAQNDCFASQRFLISAMPTRCSPNSISTLRQTSRSPLLTWICVLGRAVLNGSFQRLESEYRYFISFMASTNRKNQLLQEYIHAFQHQACWFLPASQIANAGFPAGG